MILFYRKGKMRCSRSTFFDRLHRVPEVFRSEGRQAVEIRGDLDGALRFALDLKAKVGSRTLISEKFILIQGRSHLARK